MLAWTGTVHVIRQSLWAQHEHMNTNLLIYLVIQLLELLVWVFSLLSHLLARLLECFVHQHYVNRANNICKQDSYVFLIEMLQKSGKWRGINEAIKMQAVLDCIMASPQRLRGTDAVFCLNLTEAALAQFVSRDCASALAASLFTEYFNEMLTAPGATRLRSPLHSIRGTHAVFCQSHHFLKAGSIHPHNPPPHFLPHNANWKRLSSHTIKPRNTYCILIVQKNQKRGTYWVKTIATASFRTLSPNSRVCRSTSTCSSDNRPRTETTKSNKQELMRENCNNISANNRAKPITSPVSNRKKPWELMPEFNNVSWQKMSIHWQLWAFWHSNELEQLRLSWLWVHNALIRTILMSVTEKGKVWYHSMEAMYTYLMCSAYKQNQINRHFLRLEFFKSKCIATS